MTKALEKLQKILNISDETIRYNKKLFNALLDGFSSLAEPTADYVSNFLNYIKDNYKYVYCEYIGYDSYSDNEITLACTGLSETVSIDAYIAFVGHIEEGNDALSVSTSKAISVESSGGTIIQSRAILYSNDATDLIDLVNQLVADNVTHETNIETN